MIRTVSRLALIGTVALVLVALAARPTHAVTIATVPIGNAGNAADTNGRGAVGYAFRMGATEVTNAQYVEFLNAVAKDDPYRLYNTEMGSLGSGGILRTGSAGAYAYALKPARAGLGLNGGDYDFASKPVNYVSWLDGVRFANWMHNGQPVGPQSNATTEDGAYTLKTQLNPLSVLNLGTLTRNPGAKWFLPSVDEWHKAAYYDSASGQYFNYPTGSDTAPDANSPLNDSGNSANYAGAIGFFGYIFTDVGAYSQSASPYGTFDQAGNLWEWTDALGLTTLTRPYRGGYANSDAAILHADAAGFSLEWAAAGGVAETGFRLASIPEPNSMALVAIATSALSVLRHRQGC